MIQSYLFLFSVWVIHSLELKDLLPSLCCSAYHTVLIVELQTTPPSVVIATATKDSNIPPQLLNLKTKKNIS